MNDTVPKDQDLPQRLKRSIILFTGLGLLLTGTIIAAVCLYPMYQQLRHFANQELARKAQNHALAIEQYLSRLTDTTLQITSRSRIRDFLTEYNQGLISREKLATFSRPKLADALRLAGDTVGMTRLDRTGEVAVEVADAPLWSNMGMTPEDLHQPLLHGPVATQAGSQLMVAAPILDRSGNRVGTDLVAFSLSGLARILEEINGTNHSGKVQIVMRADDKLQLFALDKDTNSSGKKISSQTAFGRAVVDLLATADNETLTLQQKSPSGGNAVTSLVAINGLDWVLSVRMGQSELYTIPNQLISILIPVIIVLVLLGAVSSILLLNPLAGKVIVQTDEYKEEIRQRTTALNDLETAHSQIDNILRSIPNGLLVCDTEQQIVLVNRIAVERLGFTSDNVLGRTLKELIDQCLIPQEMDSLGHNSASRIDQVEFSIERDGQPVRFIRAESSKMHTATGRFSGTVIILQDVTHERKLDQLKNEFISTAAHELRTPLTTLLGYTDIMLDNDLENNFSNEQKEEFLNEIHAKGETLSIMIDDLLDISRIEAGQPLPLYYEDCDLPTVVEKAVNQFSMTSQKHRFMTDFIAPPQDIIFKIDPKRIVQVIENILSNAVKYSAPGSQIKIDGKPLTDQYQFTITDEGIGIPAEDLHRIFDKFYRVDTSNTAVGGLGLGLNVAKQIVDGHGGSIHVLSTPKAGTSVFITLPMSNKKS